MHRQFQSQKTLILNKFANRWALQNAIKIDLFVFEKGCNEILDCGFLLCTFHSFN